MAKAIIRKQNSNAEAGYERKEEVKPAYKHKPMSRAEVLAEDFECVMSWQFPKAREIFPDEPWMRTVFKYYPHAKGGPLLIDEPHTPEQVKRCNRKKLILEEMGYRYVVLIQGKSEAEDRMALAECGQHLPKRVAI